MMRRIFLKELSMRSQTLSLLAAFGMCFAAPVWAQEADADTASEDATDETSSEAVPDATDEGGAAPADDGAAPVASETQPRDLNDPLPPPGMRVPGAKDSAPGTVHTVVRGDTLWDLSASYLGTPWYWPKVWSYNPQIANPHWIYPGNQVRFFPSGDDGASRVEVATESAPAPAAVMEEEEPVVPVDKFAQEVPVEDQVKVVGKIGYSGSRHVTIARTGFVSAKELEESATLRESFAETLLLSPPDTVYLEFRRDRAPPKVGDKYLIFRTLRGVHNPVTGRWLGHLTKYIGSVRILGAAKERVRARLEEAWDEIERGDRVGPSGEELAGEVKPVPNTREMNGHVVAAVEPGLTTYGDQHIVVVDRGRADGIVPGNTFTVVRQQDPSTFNPSVDPSREVHGWLPEEEVGSCITVDVKESASTCLVTRSLRELYDGDRLRMRVTPVAASAAR
ncbi:MAG: LysM peptidoglycan-binding domain-containing protein [Myxococcaceae bacterium]